MKREDHAVDLLRNELWRKEFARPYGTAERWMAQSISENIEAKLGYRIEKLKLGKGAPHTDTILNFLNRKKSPSPRVLNIISWYVQDNHEVFFSFENFKASISAGSVDHGKAETERPTKPAEPVTTAGRRTPNKRLLVLASVLVLLSAAGTAYGYFSRKDEAYRFHERFRNSDLATLRDNGWQLFNDSIDIAKWDNPLYRNNGYLTLETHPGDSWLVDRKYDPRVINILSRRIDCGECCIIKAKIVDFTPYQRYQKAGFYLFYAEDAYPSLRYSLAGDGGGIQVEAVKRGRRYENVHLIPQAAHRKRGKIGTILHKNNPELRTSDVTVDSITLSLVVDGGQYFFGYRLNEEKSIAVFSSGIPFGAPVYVGLMAQQGRPDIPHPVWPVADVIPAKFESFSIQPCR